MPITVRAGHPDTPDPEQRAVQYAQREDGRDAEPGNDDHDLWSGAILLTGFEPFGGEKRNPSQEIVRALAGREIAGRRVVGAVLPCVFGASLRDQTDTLTASLAQRRAALHRAYARRSDRGRARRPRIIRREENWVKLMQGL